MSSVFLGGLMPHLPKVGGSELVRSLTAQDDRVTR